MTKNSTVKSKRQYVSDVTEYISA